MVPTDFVRLRYNWLMPFHSQLYGNSSITAAPRGWTQGAGRGDCKRSSARCFGHEVLAPAAVASVIVAVMSLVAAMLSLIVFVVASVMAVGFTIVATAVALIEPCSIVCLYCGYCRSCCRDYCCCFVCQC